MGTQCTHTMNTHPCTEWTAKQSPRGHERAPAGVMLLGQANTHTWLGKRCGRERPGVRGAHTCVRGAATKPAEASQGTITPIFTRGRRVSVSLQNGGRPRRLHHAATEVLHTAGWFDRGPSTRRAGRRAAAACRTCAPTHHRLHTHTHTHWWWWRMSSRPGEHLPPTPGPYNKRAEGNQGVHPDTPTRRLIALDARTAQPSHPRLCAADRVAPTPLTQDPCPGSQTRQAP